MTRINSSSRISRRRAKIAARRRATRRRARHIGRTLLEDAAGPAPRRSYESTPSNSRRECSFRSSNDALIVFGLRVSPRLQAEPRKLLLLAPARKGQTSESFLFRARTRGAAERVMFIARFSRE